MSDASCAKDEAFELMGTHLADVTIEMYADFELQMSRCEVAPVTTSMLQLVPAGMSVIGYVGSGLRGALTLVALETSIERWLTSIGMEGGEPADALGEFSNMLLGRLKARMLEEGIPIQLATPTIALGCGLRLLPSLAHSTSLAFAGGGGQVRVRLDAHFDQGFAFEKPTHGEAPAQAGDGFLF